MSEYGVHRRDQFLPAYEAMQVNGTTWNGLPGGRAEAIMCVFEFKEILV